MFRIKINSTYVDDYITKCNNIEVYHRNRDWKCEKADINFSIIINSTTTPLIAINNKVYIFYKTSYPCFYGNIIHFEKDYDEKLYIVKVRSYLDFMRILDVETAGFIYSNVPTNWTKYGSYGAGVDYYYIKVVDLIKRLFEHIVHPGKILHVPDEVRYAKVLEYENNYSNERIFDDMIIDYGMYRSLGQARAYYPSQGIEGSFSTIWELLREFCMIFRLTFRYNGMDEYWLSTKSYSSNFSIDDDDQYKFDEKNIKLLISKIILSGKWSTTISEYYALGSNYEITEYLYNYGSTSYRTKEISLLNNLRIGKLNNELSNGHFENVWSSWGRTTSGSATITREATTHLMSAKLNGTAGDTCRLSQEIYKAWTTDDYRIIFNFKSNKTTANLFRIKIEGFHTGAWHTYYTDDFESASANTWEKHNKTFNIRDTLTIIRVNISVNTGIEAAILYIDDVIFQKKYSETDVIDWSDDIMNSIAWQLKQVYGEDYTRKKIVTKIPDVISNYNAILCELDIGLVHTNSKNRTMIIEQET